MISIVMRTANRLYAAIMLRRLLIFDFDCSLQGETPLSRAAALGQAHIITWLAKVKADINDRNDKARAPCNPVFACLFVHY